jgi:hypothetical protein
MTKAKQLALIWKHTHRDFRGKFNGERTILVFREGTCSVPLSTLTDAEIADKLRYALHMEARKAA